jgi:hypothetical protein
MACDMGAADAVGVSGISIPGNVAEGPEALTVLRKMQARRSAHSIQGRLKVRGAADERPLFVGSEPGKIALSTDGLVGYVAIQAAPTIKQFDALTSATTGTITVPGSAYNGSTRAEDIAVSPDNANVIAVSVRNTCCSPRHEGVFIIRNGQTLPNRTPGHTGSNTSEFGANGSTLYGHNNETTEFGFRTMTVNGSGVQTTSVTQNPPRRDWLERHPSAQRGAGNQHHVDEPDRHAGPRDGSPPGHSQTIAPIRQVPCKKGRSNAAFFGRLSGRIAINKSN